MVEHEDRDNIRIIWMSWIVWIVWIVWIDNNVGNMVSIETNSNDKKVQLRERYPRCNNTDTIWNHFYFR
jgi:hypothetical protein